MSNAYEFTVTMSERREMFEPHSVDGATIKLAVSVDPGWPPHVYQHIATALERAISQLVAYEGPGKGRSTSVYSQYEPWPLPQPPSAP